MSLQTLLDTQQRKNPTQEDEITKERIVKNLDEYRKMISYWRLYPDKFVDFLCSLNPDNTFHFFFYQRLFLRAVMRHKYIYATFVRAWSKSFMSVIALMIKATLYPGAKLFTVAGGKEQSAGILSSKVDEICRLIPAFEKEIVWDTRGTNAKTRQTKDSVVYQFKNGSTVENVAATEKTRGRRFQSGLMEECVGIDQDILNEVIIPTMNVSRMINGQTDPNERLNKSQVYINFLVKRLQSYNNKILYYIGHKEDKMLYYIYKIENLKNHKKYVGLTNNIKRRTSRHFGDLKRGVHDNCFLQKEYNIYGKENFSLEVVFKGDVSSEEISEKEKFYIKYYDSYYNGYNQNEGGNFGPTNGGTKLTETDIYNILAATEFVPRCGGALKEIFEISNTTIKRIKDGENHNEYYAKYHKKSLEERQKIFKDFAEQTSFKQKNEKNTVLILNEYSKKKTFLKF